MVTKAKRVLAIPPTLEKYVQRSRDALHWSVATSPEGRLRWVLDFVREDLDALSPAERAKRAARLEACGVHNSASRMPDTFPMPDAVLRRLHSEITRGLRIGLGDQRDEEWYVPGPARLAFSRSSPRFKPGPKGELTAPKRTRFQIREDWGDTEGWILGGIVRLLQQEGGRLRSCKECGRAFLAVKRQIYCGEECSQRTRNRAKQQQSQARG